MKRLLLIFGVCVLLVVGCLPGVAARDYSDAVAVDLAVATMTDRAPQPHPPQPFDCPRCKDTGWVTHGDGHRTPCPDCSDGSSGPYGGPLDALRDAKDLIRKGNELADRGKALLDAAQRDGKVTVDIHLPKSMSSPLPIAATCPSGVCPLEPGQPNANAIPSQMQPAASACRTRAYRTRLFWRRQR